MSGSNYRELGLRALLYVSRAALTAHLATGVVHQMVKDSLERNRRLGITGALIFTGGHFAQALEGPRVSISELMTSIRRDDRHRDITILADGAATTRRFEAWALAFDGQSRYLDRTLKRLLSPVTPYDQKLEMIDQTIAAMEIRSNLPSNRIS